MQGDFLSGKEKALLYEESKRYVQRERTKVGAMLYSLNKAHGMISLYGRGYDLLLRTPSGTFDQKEIWDEYHVRKRDLEYMRKRELVEVVKCEEMIEVQITSKGYVQSLMEKASRSCNELEDGSYCIVSYDIPEFTKNERHRFRRLLKRLGFQMLHYSTWIICIDIVDEMIEYIEEIGLTNYITVGLSQISTNNARPCVIGTSQDQ